MRILVPAEQRDEKIRALVIGQLFEKQSKLRADLEVK